MTPTKVCIVTPVFNELENLARYQTVVSSTLIARSEFDFSVIFVDDGSHDGSWDVVNTICKSDSRFRAVRLSRNFGAHTAIQAGLHYADGDAALILACDLQDPTEAALRLCNTWKTSGADIIWGVRESRNEHWSRKLLSQVFNWLLRRFAFSKDSKFTSGSFLLASRKVVAAYNSFEERQRSTFAMMAWMGFSQERVSYARVRRVAGRSGWSFLQMLNSSFDTLLSYSDMPIKVISMIGFSIFAMSIGLGAYFLFSYFAGHPPSGYTSIALLITTFFGFQFLLLGVLGEYLRRIYIEVLHRPPFVVAEKLGL